MLLKRMGRVRGKPALLVVALALRVGLGALLVRVARLSACLRV